MHKSKANSILLYKEASTQGDSRGLNISTSRSRLRNDLKQVSHGDSTPKIRPNNYSLNNKTCFKACNMEDPQVRMKRGFSPIYQTSTQQSQLFQKGLKKPEVDINLKSRINLRQNTDQKTHHLQGLSPRTIKRSDPNKQAQNILELGSKAPLSSRSLHKRNPNVESEYREARKQKSQIKDPNVESTRTADYVIKALTSHPSAQTKEIHIKFTKKENILSEQNLNKDQCDKDQKIVKQHKRHFSNIILQANKENIERKQNGICMKQDLTDKKKHERKEFNHDFYKKENRMTLNTERDQCQVKQKNFNVKTARNDRLPTNRVHLKTEHHDIHQQVNKMAQLRKRFL